MNNFNQQQLADATSSFTAFADIKNSEQLSTNQPQETFPIEKLTAFGEFATNEDHFPAC